MKQLLLGFSFCLLFAFQLSAQQTITKDGISYYTDNKVHQGRYMYLRVTGISSSYVSNYGSVVIIPKGLTMDMGVTLEMLVTDISSSAFAGRQDITGVFIPEGVTRIPGSAFADCSGLISVSIPDRLTEIGSSAFSNCTSLSTITIPEGVTEIGNNAFTGCTSLPSIIIPESVTTIGNAAFSGCTALKSIRVPAGITDLGASVFGGCTALEEFTVGADNNTYSVNDGVLFSKDGTRLIYYPYNHGVSYTIPEGITSISAGAFAYCALLTEVTIPNTVTEIAADAFYSCTGLTSINIPGNVQKIGSHAFAGCTGLTALTIPEGVITMGEYVFKECENLQTVTFPGSVMLIGDGMFAHCTGLKEITVNSNNAFYSSIDGVLFNKSRTVLHTYPASKATESYKVPEGVTTIAYTAFTKAQNIKALQLPSTLTTIGEFALQYTKLSSVDIPQKVDSIGEFAFYGCENLKDLTVHWDTPISIQNYVFWELLRGEVTLHVPEGKLAAYAEADVWQEFNITDDAITSVENTRLSNILISPSFIKEGFTITGLDNNATMTLLDASGRQVLSHLVNDNDYINISTLPEGLYIIRLLSGENTIVKKIMKK